MSKNLSSSNQQLTNSGNSTPVPPSTLPQSNTNSSSSQQTQAPTPTPQQQQQQSATPQQLQQQYSAVSVSITPTPQQISSPGLTSSSNSNSSKVKKVVRIYDSKTLTTTNFRLFVPRTPEDFIQLSEQTTLSQLREHVSKRGRDFMIQGIENLKIILFFN